MIPDSFKQDLLNRIDVVELIERYVPLKKGGANYSACCPFHSEKSPSFTVSPTKQFYHCFGCGAHGNAISFLMEYQGLGYIDALKELAESVGLKLPEMERNERKDSAGPDLYELMERALRYYREQLKAAPHAIEYLKGRGLSGKVAAHFGIGYAPDGWQNLQSVFTDYDGAAVKEAGLVIEAEGGRRYDRFRDRIMFPILNQRGSVIGFGGRVLGAGEPKYLNSPETPLFEKGRELYGLTQARNAIRSEGRALVTEGYMDVVALAQHGVEYAVATLGTATSAVHVQKLFRMTDEVVFCFDGDAAGRRAAWRALEIALPVLADNKAVRFVFLPEKDDPDSFIREHGKEAFEAVLAKAQPLSAFLLAELLSRVDAKTAEGRAQLLSSAEPYFKQIVAPLLKVQLQKQLLEAAGLTPADVGHLTGQRPRFAPAPSVPRPSLAAARSGQTKEQWLLKCLLAKPELALMVPPGYVDESSTEGEALQVIRDMVESTGPISGAAFLDRIQDTRFESLFKKLQADDMEFGVEPSDAETALMEALPRMEQEAVRNRIKALVKGPLDDAGSRELQALTQRLSELDRARSERSKMV